MTWSGEVYVDPQDTTVQFVNLQVVPLRWYQRWQVWVLGTAGASLVLVTTMTLVAAVLAAGITGAVYVYRRTTGTPPAGGGTATID